MKLGAFNMPLHPPGHDFTQTLADDLDTIVTCDRLGLTEYWLGEHFTSEWENIPAPDLVIAQALALTEQIKLGTGVSCLPNHNPFMLAHRIAQLDHMANGRFMWGIGAGGFPGDFEVFGYEEPGAAPKIMRETLDAVLELWGAAKPGPYGSGNWGFKVPEPQDDIGLSVHVRPLQKPHPPIGVAGVSKHSGTLRVAGLKGWIPMSINIVPMPLLRTHWEAVEEGAAAAGLTPERSSWRIARNIFVAETSEAAFDGAINGTLGRDFEDYFFKLLPYVGYMDLAKIDPEMPDSDVTLEYMAENIWVVGDPDEVAAKLRRLHGDVGGFGVLLMMIHEWRDQPSWRRSVDLLTNEVMPQLADLD